MAQSEQPYNELVREHFEHPRNTPCHRAAPDIVFGEAGEESAGARFRLSARVGASTLEEIRFEAYGCPHSLAAASLLTEQLAGATVEAAARWSWRSLSEPLAVPAAKRGRLLSLEDALHSLIKAAAGVGP